jgi:hypothetical protein
MRVRKNSILMPINIRKQFMILDQLIWIALGEQERNNQCKYIPQISEEREKFMKEGETTMTNLEKAIEQRLSSLTETTSL